MGHGRASMPGERPAVQGGDGVVQPQRVIPALIGPTASGKSALALAWAARTGGTILNVDAMQLYRDLRIVTARPDQQEEAQAPHRLYGVLDGRETATAARYRALATATLAETAGPVLLVGGTGLYLRALMQGLSAIPTIDPVLRAEAEALRDRLGPEGFHQAVARFDPALAARRPIGDRQRLVRGWEVYHGTGRSLTDWQCEPPDGPPPGVEIRPVVIDPPRPWLYDRIDRRFHAMVAAGAVEEVRAVEHLPVDAPLRKAVGVPELLGVLAGVWSLEAGIAKAQQASRHYAKRQTTWCRTQLAQAPRVFAQDYCAQCDEMFAILDGLPLTR
ncbi:MAG: tRNA (adenosine(37)-N6)-dimethylallyltransferase MiaA [Alphaproteobacteria bacterium]|nr:tRNA (adenosine(37)-N6)-dimethylallyltransferase MiaA [Alphaproteobacteria bacterium]